MLHNTMNPVCAPLSFVYCRRADRYECLWQVSMSRWRVGHVCLRMSQWRWRWCRKPKWHSKCWQCHLHESWLSWNPCCSWLRQGSWVWQWTWKWQKRIRDTGFVVRTPLQGSKLGWTGSPSLPEILSDHRYARWGSPVVYQKMLAFFCCICRGCERYKQC